MMSRSIASAILTSSMNRCCDRDRKDDDVDSALSMILLTRGIDLVVALLCGTRLPARVHRWQLFFHTPTTSFHFHLITRTFHHTHSVAHHDHQVCHRLAIIIKHHGAPNYWPMASMPFSAVPLWQWLGVCRPVTTTCQGLVINTVNIIIYNRRGGDRYRIFRRSIDRDRETSKPCYYISSWLWWGTSLSLRIYFILLESSHTNNSSCR